MASKSEERLKEKVIIERMNALNFTLEQIQGVSGVNFASISRDISKQRKSSSKYSAIESFIQGNL